MPRKKKLPYTDFDIPEYQLESLARVLLLILQEYLSSEQGKKDYAECQKLQLNNQSKKKGSH